MSQLDQLRAKYPCHHSLELSWRIGLAHGYARSFPKLSEGEQNMLALIYADMYMTQCAYEKQSYCSALAALLHPAYPSADAWKHPAA